jgi:hypothetical protein
MFLIQKNQQPYKQNGKRKQNNKSLDDTNFHKNYLEYSYTVTPTYKDAPSAMKIIAI